MIKKAITIDTSIFEKSKFAFENPIFVKIKSLVSNDVPVVISDIIQNEMIAHIEKNINNLNSQYKKLSKAIKQDGEFLFDVITEFGGLKSHKIVINSNDLAKRRVNNFIRDSGISVINSAKIADSEKILKDYFEGNAPFSRTKESKKQEFPDAFALNSIVKWANENDREVDFVSSDGDWKRFCETLQDSRFRYNDDLGTLLSRYSNYSIKDFSRYLVNAPVNKRYLRIHERIVELLSSEIECMNVSIEAYSSFEFEEDYTDISLSECEFNMITGEKIGAVVIDEDEQNQVIQASAKIKFIASGFYQIMVEDTKLDNSENTKEIEFETKILISIDRTIVEGPDMIKKVEIIEPYSERIYFEDIEPNFYKENFK